MTGRQAAITLDDPLGSEPEAWRPDLTLPSFFLIAATLILGTLVGMTQVTDTAISIAEHDAANIDGTVDMTDAG